jgi:hypothetical protein
VNTSRLSRRRPSLESEFLESRNLLNAHVPHAAEVHVAAVHVKAEQTTAAPKPAKAPHELSGTVTGLSTYTSNPNNANQGYDFYSTASLVKSGTATYIGTDSFTSTPVSPSTYKDTYFDGFTVLDLPGVGDISISYVGTGKSTVTNGPYTATFTGEAAAITGPFIGHEYAFKATLTGNETSGAVTLKFTLKD